MRRIDSASCAGRLPLLKPGILTPHVVPDSPGRLKQGRQVRDDPVQAFVNPSKQRGFIIIAVPTTAHRS